MIFQGTPNLLVRIDPRHRLKIKSIRFDENGEYQTENQRLIKLLSNKYPEKKEETKVESKVFTCKQCGEEFDNKGKFLAHMREHKRGE